MRSIIATSKSKDMNSALAEVFQQIDDANGGKAPLCIIFSADINMFSLVSKKLFIRYSDTKIIGSTSFLNFSSSGYEEFTINAMAIYSDVICSTGVLLNVRTNPLKFVKNITDAIDVFDDKENLCCIEFTTSYLNCEELVQDTFESVLSYSKIPLIGCSAGSPDGVNQTLVSVDGITYDEACVFMFIKNLSGKIHVFKENLFRSTGHIYKVTDVDCDRRTVYEFNHFPAAGVLAQALHTSMQELPEKIQNRPVGQIIGEKIYIADIDSINPDGTVSFFSRIYNHTDVVQLEADDVDEVWDKTFGDLKEQCPDLSFGLVINSASRTKYFMQRQIFERFDKKLTENLKLFIGFSGYGEQVDFIHQNQTMLIVAFE